MSDGVQYLDHDGRAKWLEQRRNYVTATDVARLASSAAAWETIRAEKLAGGGRDIRHVPAVAWGVEREPTLVGYAELETGIKIEANDRLAVRDGKYAATPDGLALDDDAVVEIKTGSREGLALKRKSYLDQVQMQMFVCGVSRCLFVTEVREKGDDGAFYPGAARVEVIERDDARIAELVEIADRFLAGPGEDWLTDILVADVRSAKSDLDKAKMRVDEAELALRDHIGDRDYRYSGPSGTVSYTQPMSARFDSARLEADLPELVDGFRRKRVVEEVDWGALRAAHPEVAEAYESKVPTGKRRLLVKEPKGAGK